MNHTDNSGLVDAERMIQDFEEGIITETDHACLMRLISEAPEVRRLYFDYMETVSLLKETVKVREGLNTLPISEEMIRNQRKTSFIVSLSIGLAALLLIGIGLITVNIFKDSDTRSKAIVMESSEGASYKIIFSGEKKRDKQDLRDGDKIELSSGLARFIFPSGVEAIIEGPTELQLLSELSIKMKGGLAWFRVPREGNGFTVQTDRANIVDLGTEFGVWFDGEGELQVHVEIGKVRIEPTSDAGNEQELVAAEAVVIDVDGNISAVDVRASLFRREFSHEMPYVHWSFDELENDVYPATGNIPGVELFHAEIENLETEEGLDLSKFQTKGRFGSAFSMDGKGVYAQTLFPGIEGNTARTFVAWIKHRRSFDGGSMRTPYCVWGKRQSNNHGEAWKILVEDQNDLSLESSPIGYSAISTYDRHKEGEWIHFASVYTGGRTIDGKPEIFHYINGVKQKTQSVYSSSNETTKVDTQTVDEPLLNAVPVRFGAPIDQKKNKVTVDGDMDEVYIFRGALTEDQIKQLMVKNTLDFFSK